MRLGSTALFLEGGDCLNVEQSLFDAGDLALFADSRNQCLIEANWLIKACWCLRFARLFVTPLGGANRSEFVETSCSVLPRERLTSFGGRGGRCLEELVERARSESFSTGAGGTGESGESRLIPSGSLGSSGKTN